MNIPIDFDNDIAHTNFFGQFCWRILEEGLRKMYVCVCTHVMVFEGFLLRKNHDLIKNRC